MPIQADRSSMAGIAEMSPDGVLRLQMFDAVKGADTQVLKPTDPYYKESVEMIGGIKPGERKSIPRFSGQVHMDADGTIEFVLMARTSAGGVGRSFGDAKPGDPNYETMLSRVGGLRPGETKMIPEKHE